jgi:acylphosphatase
MKRMTAIVYGRVQGVYFRDYTEREAIRLHVTGWVANQVDGTVKVVAEGSEAALMQLVEWLHTGSPWARVDGVDVEWSDAIDEFTRFRIRH